MTAFTKTITLELYINGAWVDFTRIDDETKMLGDGKSGYSVTLGQNNETGKPPPMNVVLKYQDTNGILNEDNPASPYYGKIAQYTPARILDGGNVDIVGEIASIDVDDTASRVVTLTITIASLDRRLSQNQKRKPFHSPAYRSLTASENDSTRLVYYPMEEPKSANGLTTPYVGDGSSVIVTGSYTFGDYTGHPASDRMFKFGANGKVQITVPNHSSTEHKVCSLFKFPDAGLVTDTILFRIFCAGGNTGWIDLLVSHGSANTFRLDSYDFNGNFITSDNFIDWSGYISGKDAFVSLEFTQSGTTLNTTVLVVNQTLTGLSVGAGLASTTLGIITRVVIAYTDCTDLAMGHFIVGNDTTAFDNFISPTLGGGLGTRGFARETAGWRLFRLATEEGFLFDFTGDLDDTQRMGPQRKGVALPDLLTDVQKADQGILYCEKAGNGQFSQITYRTVRSMYNQAPAFTVDVSPSASVSQLSGSLKPMKDDQGRRNDVTITRDGGASTRYVIRDGDPFHFSTEDPPAGMGDVDSADTVSLYQDSQAKLIAAWLAHLGSWRGPRFPKIKIDPWRDAVRNDSALVQGIANLELGDIISVNTTSTISAWVPKNDFRLMARGYQVTKAQTNHTAQYNCTPGEAWEVEMTDSISSTLSLAVDSDDTEFYFDTATGPAWRALSVSNVPFYVQVNGDVSKATFLETLTPTFVAAGTPAHGSNASVNPGAPAGTQNGDLLILFGAIRNQGAGTVDLLSGWTDILNFGNMRMMGRYRDGTAADTPTVTFTGGVANATTSACIAAFRNLSLRPVTTKTIFNGSTQNIGYQGYKAYPLGPLRYSNNVQVLFGWKQDDWTGVAPPSGFTEAIDTSSTTGDDQGITMQYRIDTTPTAVGNSQIVVTGGAVALNSGIIAALRPLQHATVVRNINSSAVSHAVGTFLRTWRPGVTGL